MSIEKFICTKQQNKENFSKRLSAYSEEAEKKLSQNTAEQKNRHCIIEGLKITQYGTMFSVPSAKSERSNPAPVLSFAIK